MTNNLDDILKIIEEEINLMNEKYHGISFLELIKFNIIPRLSTFKKKIEEIEYFENKPEMKFEKNNNKLNISLVFNKEPKSYLKKEITQDTLYIVLKGQLTIDFLEKLNKNNKTINIYPFMGVCFSSESIINLNLTKDTFFIKLINFYPNSNIEKLKKDII